VIPPFDPHAIFVEPWTTGLPLWGWIFLMGGLVATPCALLGCFLVLRRLALVGDAVSHAVLPGLVLAYMYSGSLSAGPMWLGAVAAGVLSTMLVEGLHRRSKVKQDAAMGIVLTGLFALGVVLLSVFADSAHLDADCVLFGDISYVPLQGRVGLPGVANGLPVPVARMGCVSLVVVAATILFYRPLLVTSFDASLAQTIGFSAGAVHYGLMSAVSVTIVSAFESVGAVLVVAMMILPAASAFLCVGRLTSMLMLAVGHGWLSSLLGIHLALWLNCSVAAAMVVAGFCLFVFCVTFGPRHGLMPRRRRVRAMATNPSPSEKEPAP
jgi:manganese/zinc/iron transport system permease protein